MALTNFIQMKAKTVPYIRPYLNVGCLIDIPTGEPVLGEFGRYITNGGLNGSMVFVGPGNSYKSAIADHVVETAMFRAHRFSSGQKYDTENNSQIPGLEKRLSRIVGKHNKPDWFETGRWIVTDSSLYKVDKWFTMFKEWCYEKEKGGADYKLETPILDRNGKKIKMIIPTGCNIDSLSKAEPSAVTELRDKSELGSSKQNMLSMNAGRIKYNMINELPDIVVATNTYLVSTVHYGEQYQLDPYAPVHKPLQHLDTGMELKGVPNNISYLAMSMWLITGVSKMTRKDDKNEIEYPLKDGGMDNNPEDLNIVRLKMLRCKTGPSGYSINLLVSQKYGVLEELTNFHTLRVHGGYGLTGDMSVTGNFKDSYCVLLPNLKLTRKTIRTMMDDNRRLARAIQICADMLQMKTYWFKKLHEIDSRLVDLTPELLYTKIIEQGYNWDMILDTRYWYSLDDDNHDQLELSTLDIMRMALGTYHPFWLESDKQTIKKKYMKKIEEANAPLSQMFEDRTKKA